MTEAALSGGADAPVEVSGAPIEATPVDVPNALGSQTPVAEKPAAVIEDKPAKTAGEAVRKAMEKVKADQAEKDAAKVDPDKAKDTPKAEVKAEPKPVEKPTTERGPDGKFTAPQATEALHKAADTLGEPAKPVPAPAEAKGTIHEPPARFDAAAKAEWANAPESVKGAVHRTVRELEAGIEEHRQRWEPVKQYDDMAKQYGTDLPSALNRYVAMDKLLSQDLSRGLDSVIRDKTGGEMGLREFVAQLTGQQPDQAQSRSDATIHALHQQIEELKQQVGGVTTHLKSQVETTTQNQVVQFAADKPQFEALAPQIAEHIRAGLGLEAAYDKALSDAQELARSLGFVPQPPAGQPLTPAPVAPQPLKPAGQKSVSGAPATGSDPASVKQAPAPSIREALRRAQARVA